MHNGLIFNLRTVNCSYIIQLSHIRKSGLVTERLWWDYVLIYW